MKKKIVILASLATMLFSTSASAAYVPTYGGPIISQHEETDKKVENKYIFEVNNDMETLISVANSIGIDRVYNSNYDYDTNMEVKRFYESMSKAEKISKNRDEIISLNKEYVKRIAATLSQKQGNRDMVYYLRFSYCNKLGNKYPEMKELVSDMEKEKKEDEKIKLLAKKAKEKESKDRLILLLRMFLGIGAVAIVLVCLIMRWADV